MKIRSVILGFGALAMASTMSVAQTADPDYDKVVGNWAWEDIVVEVSRCAETELCAKVVKGGTKCGGKMIRSKMTKVDANNGTGDVCHPKDGKIYKSKITYVDADTVTMKGSSGGTVAEGTFKRVK
jgi:uncharacterized protein (DUF2147 family)